MADVIPFVCKREVEAEKNVRDFIRFCKDDLEIYGKELLWDEMRWDVSVWHRRRGHRSKKTEMVFTRIGSTRAFAIYMEKPFSDFAKAYMRHEMTFRFEKNFSNHLTALKILEKSLIECSRDGLARVHLTNESVASFGANIIMQHFKSKVSQYDYGCRFAKLIKKLVEYGFTATSFEWTSPIPRPAVPDVSDKDFDKYQIAKLPSPEVLAAIGTIFDQATEDRDVITSSCIALLCSAPSRICEPLTMQKNCKIWLKNADGTRDLSLQLNPAKKGIKNPKLILKVMEPIALEAIDKISKLTDEGRAIAKWYEKNPDKIYLPIELEYLRAKEMLDGNELAMLFGWDRNNSHNNARFHGLTVYKGFVERNGRPRKDGVPSVKMAVANLYSFAEVERKVLSLIPPDFPWLDESNGVKYSNGLFVVRRGTFNTSQGIMPCMMMGVTVGSVFGHFAAGKKSVSIFSRYGFDQSYRVTTHQLRHWLNTLAERGGLSDLERDMWSGRRTSGGMKYGETRPTSRQSLAYLHNDTEDLLEAVGLTAEAMDLTPSFSNTLKNLPISLEEFGAMSNKPTVHVTEYGVCFHDFAMQPCPVHGDCLNCQEHACVKGDVQKEKNIKALQKIVIEQMEMAKNMIANEYLKAEPWYQSHELTLKRLEGLIKILDDENIPANSVIMLANPFTYSAFINALEDRSRNAGDEYSLALAKTLRPLHAITDYVVGDMP